MRGIIAFAVNLVVHFLPMHIDRPRGFDAQSDFVTANLNNGDLDHIVDDNALVFLPGEY